MTEKKPAEKSRFDFFAGFVLAEELGDSARHQWQKFILSYLLNKNNWKFQLFFSLNTVHSKELPLLI
ncbi:hypothetical protein [Metabacillus idriensis]|uniref:hypothetical protein n=1 Tax=Metabacillus idriensis TaxID=324768 RepID=UPI001749F15F|nr:hypothetical protein [Metabacillus idriensis]